MGRRALGSKAAVIETLKARGIAAKDEGDRITFLTVDEEQARMAWSYLDEDNPDSLHIEERGWQEAPGDDVYRSWWPVGPGFRLLRDKNRLLLVILSPLFFLVLLLGLAWLIGLTGAPIDWILALGFAALEILGLHLFTRSLRDGELSTGVVGIDKPWARLLAGVPAGLIWAWVTGLSARDFLGAITVFTFGTILWTATIGWDRARFRFYISHVGERAPWSETYRYFHP